MNEKLACSLYINNMSQLLKIPRPEDVKTRNHTSKETTNKGYENNTTKEKNKKVHF